MGLSIIEKHWYLSGAAADPAGLTLLKEDSYIYVDFGLLAEDDGETIVTNLAAYGTLAATISPINSPVVKERLIAGSLRKTLGDYLTQCMSIGDGFDGIVNQNFEVWFAVSGEVGSAFQVCGSRQLAADSNRQFLIFTSSGEVRMNWGYTGTRFIWRTTSAVFPATPFGLTVCCLQADFTADTVTLYVDGVSVAGTFSTGTIVGKDPALFDTTVNGYIASQNNEGTAVSNADQEYFHDFAIKGISTAEERSQIFEYLTTQKYE